MSVDYLSRVDTLRGELDQFRTLSRSMADIAVLKVALSQLRRTLGSVEVDGPTVVPDDPERRWGWLLLVSLVEVSQREIEECERRYGLNS